MLWSEFKALIDKSLREQGGYTDAQLISISATSEDAGIRVEMHRDLIGVPGLRLQGISKSEAQAQGTAPANKVEVAPPDFTEVNPLGLLTLLTNKPKDSN